MNIQTAVTAIALALACGGGARAQHLLLVSSGTEGPLSDPITFQIVADGNIGGAVAWGSPTALSDPLHMNFVSNLDGAGDPYRALQSYFDTDFTDASATGNGRINFDFLNTTPGAHFGYNGYAPLVEFQVLLSPSSVAGTDLTVTLGALGIPPNGTAAQDESANNILLPSDPLHPANNVSTAHIVVGGGAAGHPLFWQITDGASDVPEPSGWLLTASGMAGSLFLLRRRRAA